MSSTQQAPYVTSPMMTADTPAKRSRMSAIVVAYMSRPSGNCSATADALSCWSRQMVFGTSKL